MMLYAYLSLLLIPIVSVLNHEGGQNTTVPNPRIVFRVVLIPLAFCAYLFIAKTDIKLIVILELVSTIGMALWATFEWGPGFMSINAEDHRDYISKWYQSNFWLTKFADFWCDTNRLTVLTPAQCKRWGTVYMTVRGAFEYPMFIAMTFLYTPFSLAIGLTCFLQGIIYRTSSEVLYAEYKYGAIIGGQLSALIICRALTGSSW
jgi:hypothetical protein